MKPAKPPPGLSVKLSVKAVENSEKGWRSLAGAAGNILKKTLETRMNKGYSLLTAPASTEQIRQLAPFSVFSLPGDFHCLSFLLVASRDFEE